jgi:hypothetical protein
MPFLVIIALLSASTTMMSCGRECFDVPTVEVRMAAQVQRSGNTANVVLYGDAVDDRYNNPYPRRFLLDDISTSAAGATWNVTAPANPDVLNWLAIQLQGSFQPGDVIQVVSVPESHVIGVWGDAPLGARGIHVSAPGFTTVSASGTLHVLAVAPLNLRLDVLVANDTGEEIRIQGDMVASSGQFESCSD